VKRSVTVDVDRIGGCTCIQQSFDVIMGTRVNSDMERCAHRVVGDACIRKGTMLQEKGEDA
jgi:hypothetical protein